MKRIISYSLTLRVPPLHCDSHLALQLYSACLGSQKATINAVCPLQNNHLNQWLKSHSLHPLLLTVCFNKKRCNVFILQQELPTTESPELKGHRAVDSERGVRGHGNGLINKVLYFFAISFRGHRQWISYQGYNRYTKPGGKVKPCSEV